VSYEGLYIEHATCVDVLLQQVPGCHNGSSVLHPPFVRIDADNFQQFDNPLISEAIWIVVFIARPVSFASRRT